MKRWAENLAGRSGGKWAVFGLTLAGAAGALSLGISGCGKGSTGKTAALGTPLPDDQVTIPVKGVAGFGSQCPYGSQAPAYPVKLEFWGCNLPLNQVELSEPMQPLIFTADCKMKIVTVRTLDRTLDTAWEMMPDNTFYFTVEGLTAKIKNDGAGNSDCSVPLSTDMWGNVDCSDPDKAKIKVESVFWVNRPVSPQPSTPRVPTNPDGTPNGAPNSSPDAAPSPNVVVMPSPTIPPVIGTACSMPVNKCYFHALTEIKQCQ